MRADASRNAGRIIDAAREVVGESGAEFAMDEVARRAGVGNATLYRHFPTRGDVLVAVYADEVDALCRRAADLLVGDSAVPPVDALFAWLDDFVVHVASKRALALAVTGGPAGRRTHLFERWHESMRAATAGLLERARAASAVPDDDVTATDLLALASGAALAAADAAGARRLLALARRGLAPRGLPIPFARRPSPTVGGSVMTETGIEAPPEFIAAAEPLRRELLAHCYRMLGSVADAEDAVQETYLRAWRAFDRFEGRSSVRSWLYRIATNACLTAMERRDRRPLPSGLGGPADDPHTPLVVDQSVAWLQPLPDALVAPSTQDPGEIVASRESLRLALVASLQYLPARQRAVLILRDVLAFSAAEVAEMLDITVAAVKSTLQRARGRLDDVAPARDDVVEPSEPERRALLDRYIEAIENADPDALRQLLRDDLVLEATPQRTWYDGVATCLPFLVRHVFSAGRWRLLPTSANGQPAAVAYVDGGDGVFRAYGAIVLTVTAEGIRRINAFGEPGLAAAFGCPAELEGGFK